MYTVFVLQRSVEEIYTLSSNRVVGQLGTTWDERQIDHKFYIKIWCVLLSVCNIAFKISLIMMNIIPDCPQAIKQSQPTNKKMVYTLCYIRNKIALIKQMSFVLWMGPVHSMAIHCMQTISERFAWNNAKMRTTTRTNENDVTSGVGDSTINNVS